MTRRRSLANDAGARAGAAAFVLLLAVYLATLAPRVTFWDAGEFIAAAESFGVPHPPGTPLYVTLARAWRLAFAFLMNRIQPWYAHGLQDKMTAALARY